MRALMNWLVSVSCFVAVSPASGAPPPKRPRAETQALRYTAAPFTEVTLKCLLNGPCTLQCPAEGDIKEVFWYNGKSLIPIDFYPPDKQLYRNHDYKNIASMSLELPEGGVVLRFRGVEVKHQDRYRCKVIYSNGHITDHFVILRVHTPILEVSIHQEQQQLLCRSERIYPKPVVNWSVSTEANTTVSESEQGLFTVVSAISVSDSEEQYICNINTDYDWRSATYRNNAKVSVSDSGVIVKCSEPSAPVKSLIWSFNHNETILTKTGSGTVYTESWRPFVELTESNSLELKDLTQDQLGLFSCELFTESEQFIINTEVTEDLSRFNLNFLWCLLILAFVAIGFIVFICWKKNPRANQPVQ